MWWVGQVGEGWAHLQVVVLGWVSKWVQKMKGRRKMKEYLVEVGFGKMVDLHSMEEEEHFQAREVVPVNQRVGKRREDLPLVA